MNLVSNVWTTNGYTVVGSGPFTNGFDAVINRIDIDSKDDRFFKSSSLLINFKKADFIE